ncbi:MAG: NADH-quinone oxidoreductase subunit [Actinomycetota bacterium]|jgi:NADH-quinone oxidoreductase subunit J
MQAENVAFGIIAAAMCVAAIRVVTTKNIVHAALYLVVVLGGVGMNFILLGAEFTAVTQLIVYIGAVVVLFLFGIFLTRAPIGRSADLDNDQRWLALLTSVMLLGVLVFVLEDAFGNDKLVIEQPQTSAEVGNSIFQTFVIPFEVVSVLLLAALIGAIVIARRD